jgi:hypothetical protein
MPNHLLFYQILRRYLNQGRVNLSQFKTAKFRWCCKSSNLVFCLHAFCK